jgi:hypothetical protein
MLKFSKTPVLRRKAKSLRVAKAKVYTQHYEAVDQFGELAGRKRDAATRARALGHDLIPWHQRPNDPAGRWNAYCATCNSAVVVCTETPDGFEDIYGPAVMKDCAEVAG